MRARRRKRGILLENRALYLAQRRTGLDPELGDERPARALKRLKRVGLATAAIQRHHLLCPKALVQGMLCDELLELGDQLGIASTRQVRVNRALQRDEAKLVKARRDRSRARLLGEIGERGPAPQRQRPAELRRGHAKPPVVERPRARACPAFKDPEVQRAINHGCDVAAPPRRDHIATQNLTQLRDIRLKHVSSGDRWLLGPDLVHEPCDGYNLVCAHEEKGQQRPLARTAEARRHPVDKRLERAEHPKLESEPGRA